MEIDLSHLKEPRLTGWGYIPSTDEVLNAFYEIKEIVNPKTIMEIGFNAGHSTTYLLEIFKDAEVHSIGPSPKLDMEKIMKEKYGDRFTFHFGRTDEIRDSGFRKDFDLVFIDGHHGLGYVTLDLAYSIRRLKAKWILMDNFEQPQVREATLPYQDILDNRAN